MFNDYGPDTTKVFLNQAQKVSNYWVKNHGYTIGIGDAVPSEETRINVNHILDETKKKIHNLINDPKNSSVNDGKLEEMINMELNSV